MAYVWFATTDDSLTLPADRKGTKGKHGESSGRSFRRVLRGGGGLLLERKPIDHGRLWPIIPPYRRNELSTAATKHHEYPAALNVPVPGAC
jgi:hypothetical protein